MTLGYSMDFCDNCGGETNHRIVEQNGKTRKECVACREQIAYWSKMTAARALLTGSQSRGRGRSHARA